MCKKLAAGLVCLPPFSFVFHLLSNALSLNDLEERLQWKEFLIYFLRINNLFFERK